MIVAGLLSLKRMQEKLALKKNDNKKIEKNL